MRRTLTALAAAAAIALAGCSTQPAATTPSPAPGAGTPASGAPATAGAAALLDAHGLTGLTGRQIVEKLDADPTPRPLAMTASVRSDHVLIGDGRDEVRVPIESDDRGFYLSVAPYANRTHPCHFHSLASCQGELAGRAVHVTITDAAGTVLVDEDATTHANGFVGFWVPRDITGSVRVSADGLAATAPFASGPQDATCLTTLHLR